METNPDEYLTAPQLDRRYNKCRKTIDRWIEQGILPRPVVINGRWHWLRSELEQHERERIAATTA